jgi:DNA (cytosine-5)-methyltransferase 1
MPTSWPTPNTPSGGAKREIHPNAYGRDGLGGRGDSSRLDNATSPRQQPAGQGPEGQTRDEARLRVPGDGCGQDLLWLPCTDGKQRPTQPGIFPLAHGIPARVAKLRAAGNAIVPRVAAEVIKACGLNVEI